MLYYFLDSPGKPIGTKTNSYYYLPDIHNEWFNIPPSAYFSAKSTHSHIDLRRMCDVIALYRYDVSMCNNNFLRPEIDFRI